MTNLALANVAWDYRSWLAYLESKTAFVFQQLCGKRNFETCFSIVNILYSQLFTPAHEVHYAGPSAGIFGLGGVEPQKPQIRGGSPPNFAKFWDHPP